LSPANAIVHAPYIVNLANPDREKREFAVSFLSNEVRRTADLFSDKLVLHPGMHLGTGIEKGILSIAGGLDRIIANTEETGVRICLETMAGKGTEIGSDFREIRRLIDLVENKERLGVCMDTCHMNDAGYDVGDIDGLLDLFDREIGLSYLKVIHLNDSKSPRSSHKDRHENIGFGSIGFAALCRYASSDLLKDIPKILETPYVKSKTHEKLSYPPYRREIAMIRSKTFDPGILDKIIKDNEEEEN